MISRVGADKDIKVDVRAVAATNKDLKRRWLPKDVSARISYHRLAVILIKVPSLNERRDDIPLLISHFTDKIASDAKKEILKMPLNSLQE
jgi:transcriptional regulator with GAF, ATPase, and Fis domain